MADMSADQLSDLQADLSIDNSELVWTDAELNRLYTRAGEDYDQTIVLALRQLLMSASRFNDYTAGQTSEKKSQVYQQIKDTLIYYEDNVLAASNQVVIAGMRSVPPITKELPDGEVHPDVKNRRHNENLPPFRWRWR